MKRTDEQNKEIVSRILLIMQEKDIKQKQLEELTEISQTTLSKYFNCKLPVGDSLLYSLTCNFFINPRWLEFGENPVYLSPNVEQNNANNGNGTQLNNINVNMTMPKEAWEMLQSQQKTIESQQDSVKMAQVNMMEIIKTFNK